MGLVYEAYDPLLDRAVAIKVLRPGANEARLRREAKALGRLAHPNVVAVHDVGEVRGRFFIVLEFVEGVTLREWLLPRRDRRQIIELVVAAGRGLAASHAAGLIHRDFKPDNVMVGYDGRPRVLDFGVASVFEEQEQRATPPRHGDGDGDAKGGIFGTPAYMAPEQRCCSAVSPLADQFSFCVVLWEALFGERPHRPSEFLKLVRSSGSRTIPPRSISNVPDWLRQLLERGLMLDAAARHPSLAVLLDAIEAGLAL